MPGLHQVYLNTGLHWLLGLRHISCCSDYVTSVAARITSHQLLLGLRHISHSLDYVTLVAAWTTSHQLLPGHIKCNYTSAFKWLFGLLV
ncbi:hypothetical protein TNCV_2082191 [Trichonephila clavipes]|nr:hypothetical protein TNCV_2082191 [Trichonephila clavipes]